MRKNIGKGRGPQVLLGVEMLDGTGIIAPMSLCPLTLLRKLSTMPYAALAIAAVSVVSLLFAYTAEYAFDIKPCILCLFQRIPYAVAFALGLIAFLLRKDPAKFKIVLALIALTFFVNVGIASFHTGVERHWWAGTNGCAVQPLDQPLSRESLLTMAVAQCDEINFEIFGLTFANLNVLFCLALGLFTLLVAFGQGILDKILGPVEAQNCACCCCCKKD